MSVQIAALETGVIRVFALNQSPDQMTDDLRVRSAEDITSALLGTPIAKGGAEIVALRDLASLGLSGYLADGYAVPDDQLIGMRRKLDALDGYALLVFSSAFDGKAVTLAPGPDATLIGTFGEAQADNTVTQIESDSAAPYTGAHEAPKTPSENSRAGSLVVGAIALLLLVIIIGWIIL